MNGSGNGQTSVGRTGLIGLLVIQMLLGYEWFKSGITKVVRGGFPSGLADELREKSEGVPGWYSSFLDWGVIPHGDAWGYLIEIGELLIGIGLIGAAVVWLARWDRLPDAGRAAVLIVTALAAVGAIVMNLGFHFANGSAHPWLIPADGFDEGVDLDSLMPAMELVLVGVTLRLLRAQRRSARDRAVAAR